MTDRAVLYLRLSHSTDESTSIARQEADLRQHAERQGWQVVEVLVDDGVSGRRSRDRADRAVAMLASGEADVLAVAALDRFTRQGIGAIGRLVEALERNPRARFVALRDGLDSASPAWRLIASVLSEVARTEAENTATRVRSSISFRLAHDRYIGGATIPYGYRSEPVPADVVPPGRVLVVDPFEASIVREVAARILGGEPITRIAADLTARGVPTSKSEARRAARRGETSEDLARGIWTATTVRKLWTSESLLGRVTREGRTLRDAEGIPRAVWEPILTPETLAAIKARLPERKREPGKPPRKRAARLLSSLAYCAECDSRLYVTTSSGKPVYRCGARWNGRACSAQVAAAAPPLEEYVAEQFLAAAGDLPEYAAPAGPHSGPGSLELAEIEDALRGASLALMDDTADAAEVLARVEELKRRRAVIRAEIESIDTTPRRTGRTLREAWEADLDVEDRRALLLTALDHVSVRPTSSRSKVFDTSRVAFHWHDVEEDYDAP